MCLLPVLQKKLRLKESRGEGGKTLNGSFNSFDDDDEESIRRIARQFEQKYVSIIASARLVENLSLIHI